MNKLYKGVIQPTLKGVGQIALINSALTGALFLIALLCHDLSSSYLGERSWTLTNGSLTLATLLGALSSLTMARLIKADIEAINQGLYGYNGALLGLASATFFTPSGSLLLLVLTGAAFTSLVMHTWRWKIPPFTFPFLITIAVIFHIAPLFDLSIKTNVAVHLDPSLSSLHLWGASALNGIGQVLFQQGLWFSVIALIAMSASSIKTSAWALAGATIGLSFGLLAGFIESGIAEAGLINLFNNNIVALESHVFQGLYGFNGALIALALSQSHSFSKWTIILGIITASIVTWIGYLFALTLLTFPFVLSAWVITFFTQRVKVNQGNNEEVLN